MRNNDLDINHQAELRRCSSLDEFFITTPSNQLLLFFALEPPPVDCIFLIHPLYFFATEKLITRQQKVPKNGKFVLIPTWIPVEAVCRPLQGKPTLAARK
jgi:hypothetical protein